MSSDVVIRVEGLGKRYPAALRDARGSLGARLSAHLKEFIPFLRRPGDEFWALRDVSFEVRRGEILGIVGQNGSGKSTLLKILSRITPPTTGRAWIKGRVGSLLEVGTGFHPDMTGRENVFFSGALLGLGQREIRARFDEIVEFSGIAEFIDMPVKRYSSGMYVRLAYAVASMLRADIMILDEVMAVGDAAFREKSRRNIEQAARDGRTILFVSHNMSAVASLCTAGLILDHGRCVYRGDAKTTVAEYLKRIFHYDDGGQGGAWRDLTRAPRLQPPGTGTLAWISTHGADGRPTTHFATGQPVRFHVGFRDAKAGHPYISVLLHNSHGERVATFHSTHSGTRLPIHGDGYVTCAIDELRLGDGTYYVMVDYGSCPGAAPTMISMDCVPNAMAIEVSLEGAVPGIGLSSFHGALHSTRWAVEAAARPQSVVSVSALRERASGKRSG